MDGNSSMRVDYQAIAAKVREHHPGPNPGMTIAEYSVESSVAAFADALDDLADEQTSASTDVKLDGRELNEYAHMVVATYRDLKNSYSPYIGQFGFVTETGKHYVYATCNGETRWWHFGDA